MTEQELRKRMRDLGPEKAGPALAFFSGYLQAVDMFPDGRVPQPQWERIRALKVHASEAAAALQAIVEGSDRLTLPLLERLSRDRSPKVSAQWPETLDAAANESISSLLRIVQACDEILMESTRLNERGVMLMDCVVIWWDRIIGGRPSAKEVFSAIEWAQDMGARLDPYVLALTEKNIASILDYLHKCDELSSRLADDKTA